MDTCPKSSKELTVNGSGQLRYDSVLCVAHVHAVIESLQGRVSRMRWLLHEHVIRINNAWNNHIDAYAFRKTQLQKKKINLFSS